MDGLMNSKLDDTERNLCELFSKAIFTNPFTSRRRETDCKISGLPSGSSDNEILLCVTEMAAKQIVTLQESNRRKFSSFHRKSDSQLVRNLYLFHLFHQCSGVLDNHILCQASEKNGLIPIPQADDILRSLHSYGFSRTEALHYFALFFQMRRAYFFIQRSLIGSCSAMMQLRAQLWNNIFTHDISRYAATLWQQMENFSTLLLGETGTGKSLAAAAIGRSGYIPFNPKNSCFKDNFAITFVSLNLSQFSEQLIESELFGHKKGSFTGAIQSHRGIFSLCSPHGAIFLDEIGDATIPIQIKLLQVLQERNFTPVGSREEQRFSGRVIAATNRPLDQMRKQGTFRNDFYYRLCSDKISIPPLRVRVKENREELSLLISFLLQKVTGQKDPVLTQQVIGIIKKETGAGYLWPGNVRELEQCIRQVLLNNHCFNESPNHEKPVEDAFFGDILHGGTVNITELTARYCGLLYNKYQTFQAVARITGLDRRTVKKYLDIAATIV
jgi:two-component system, NtrC family, response regulator HydG